MFSACVERAGRALLIAALCASLAACGDGESAEERLRDAVAAIEQAVEAGARCVTHLGNGCNPMMRRHPNILWQQAAEDRLYAGASMAA